MCAIIYVVEWQKRGPPHAHILAICNENSKPRTTQDYDSIVSAEIPDPEKFPNLHKVVTKFMIHGPCGAANPKCPCMIDGQCSKRFPKEYVNETNAGPDGYPHYRRRNTGLCVYKSGVPLDNKYIVPYNPYLSRKYNAHINVEICSSIQSCKYLYKYVYKGPDMASVGIDISDRQDEIKRFVNSRFITASECMWRFFSFDVHGRDPSIQHLAVHELNQQSVTFNENDVVQALKNAQKTTLIGWFQLNREDTNARQYKYHEIPEHYVWDKRKYKWTPQKQGRCIGRMYTTNPAQGDRHYLRLLLSHVPGAMSFDDLRTMPDGTQCGSFKETAVMLGLLATDEEWNQCLCEAVSSFMPYQIRSLFVTIVVFGEPVTPLDLWTKYKNAMGEDILQKVSNIGKKNPTQLQEHIENSVLLLLQNELYELGTCLGNFGLPCPQKENIAEEQPRIITDELFDESDQEKKTLQNLATFNSEQTEAYERILKAILDSDEPQHLFFVNAPGGYGKTFLMETLLSSVRAVGKIALAVASSGIAAELLEGGRTAHSRFKIPIPISNESVCSISLQSSHAELMRTSLLCWDEVLMSDKQHIECVDRSLRDILKVDKPFGGITVVFGGDPRQILPVVRHGDRPRIVQACVKSSTLWQQVCNIRLKTNMRLDPQESLFSEYLLSIGEGTAQVFPDVGDDVIQLPPELLVESLPALISKVFPKIQDGYEDKYFVARRAILTPKNEYVDKINTHVMSLFPGKKFCVQIC